MALTVTIDDNGHRSSGAKRITQGTMTFDASYATGGETYTLADLRLSRLDSLEVEAVKGSEVFESDLANLKVIARDEALAEISAATDLSAVVIRYTATGA